MTGSAATRAVLVVEDEILVRVFAVDALEDAGFRVEQAGTASEAMQALRVAPDVEAALVDVGLPDRPGDQLAAEMHALRADLPIVIASGRSESELKERFGADAKVAILVKPYTAPMLIRALASLGVKGDGVDAPQ
jgi:CheY-like chemotaxis protein